MNGLTGGKHGLNIVSDVAEDSPIPFWMAWLRWQRLDLYTLNDRLTHLGLGFIKDSPV
jgi:hypothetical protein